MDKRKAAVKAYKFASLNGTPEDAAKNGRKKHVVKAPGKTASSGFLKEGAVSPETVSESDSGDRKGYRKAAKFLLLLGKKEAAEVLSHFSESEIEKITKEIASIKRIPKDESVKILSEFGYLKPSKPYSSNGGVEAAKEMLLAAFGEDKGSEIFNRVLPFGGEKPFAFLEDLEDEQLIMVLRKESEAVLAVIFSYLDPSKASVVLESLHPEVQKSLVKRMAVMRRVAPEAIRAIESTLIERVRTQGKVITEEIDGSSVLASILKNMDLFDEGRILSSLAEEDEKLSMEVREKLFTVDSVLDLRDKDLQKVLRDYSDGEIAVLLKGRSTEFREKILKNLSARRREFVLMEEEASGPVLRSEADKVMKDFLDYLKDLEARGAIVLASRKDEYI